MHSCCAVGHSFLPSYVLLVLETETCCEDKVISMQHALYSFRVYKPMILGKHELATSTNLVDTMFIKLQAKFSI